MRDRYCRRRRLSWQLLYRMAVCELENGREKEDRCRPRKAVEEVGPHHRKVLEGKIAATEQFGLGRLLIDVYPEQAPRGRDAPKHRQIRLETGRKGSQKLKKKRQASCRESNTSDERRNLQNARQGAEREGMERARGTSGGGCE